MQHHDIKQILRQIRGKDPAGFELLYQHYFRFLFSVAYSVLGREEDCYDVIQSVMLRLYQLDENLFPSDHELSWLKTVVKNEALMYLRREKKPCPWRRRRSCRYWTSGSRTWWIWTRSTL